MAAHWPPHVLFVGLGSIGTRHLTNLKQLCPDCRVDALRSDLSRPLRPGAAQLLDRQFTSLDGSGARKAYDMVFLCNPTALHGQALRQLRRLRVGAYFIEKPILDASEADTGPDELLPPGQKAYVAAPMRWCGVMLALKERLPALRPYSVRAICSSYLPDWRPGTDYRASYSAHKELGGGVSIDLIHEWDYLVDLFGVPEEVYNLRGTYSHLEVDSDDLSVYIARYPGLLAELHLDYFGRSYRRTLELFCRDGTVTADFGAGTLTLEDGSVLSFEEPVNERYLRELRWFLRYAREGGESPNSPRTALDVLKLTAGKHPTSGNEAYT